MGAASSDASFSPTPPSGVLWASRPVFDWLLPPAVASAAWLVRTWPVLVSAIAVTVLFGNAHAAVGSANSGGRRVHQ
jgi:hypothetical protein